MEYELQQVGTSTQKLAEKSEAIYQQPSPSSDSSISPVDGNIASETASIRPRDKVSTGWMPLVLRPWSLFIFLLVFMGVFITLIGLYVRSKQEQGLSNERESRHYLWTYGPTAVFIVLAAFWRHLDYQVKLLMPYVELAEGPKHAKLTVMLDYISPFQPVAFWYACKNRHWLVILSAIAFATLKVAIIFATGLFILQGTAVQTADKNFLRYQNQFSAAGFDPGLDSRASLTVFGVTSLNLSYPAGTNHFAAFQKLTNIGNVPLDNIASISIPADVFSAKLDCEPARLEWKSDRDLVNEITPLSQFYNTTAFAPGCTLKKIRLDAPSWLGNETQQGYYARIQNSTCDEIRDPAAGSRLFVAMTFSTRVDWNNTLRNYTAFVCKHSYAIQKHQITLPNNRLNDYSQISEMRPIGENSSLPGFTSKDLTDGIVSTLSASYSQLYNSGWDVTFDPFFALMAISRPQLNYTAFMEPGVLKSAAEELYSTIAAQVAGSALTQPTTDTTVVDAVVSKIQQRLILRPVSVIVMEIIVAILILITILLIVLIPRQGVAPRDPSSIGALATILSRSKALEQSLSGTSNLTEKDLESWLHRYRFYSRVEASSSGRIFRIELEDMFPNAGHKQRYSDEIAKLPVPPETPTWWKPLGLKWWVIIPLVIFPVIIIVVLEVLYRKSEREQGLAYIPDGGYVHYTWVYVPALVMVAIVTLFNMLDYATRCVAPYQAMRADSAAASRGILYSPNGKLTLPALWHAIKQKHITVIATTFAVLIAPILTIAVSGLFYAQLVASTSTLSVQQTTWFNNTSPGYSPNNTDEIITSLIISGNLSYPRWTYEDMAFAELSMSNETLENTEAAEGVTLSVPAIRAALNCSIIEQDRYLELRLGEEVRPARGQNLTDLPVWVNISMPDQCGNSGTIYDNVTWVTNSLQHPQTGYFGSILTLGFQEGCPGFALFYGKMNNNKIANFSTLFCSGYTQSLEVETTFILPNFTTDTTTPGVAPPRRKEETARWFSNQAVDIGFSFPTLRVNASAPDIFDPFLNALAYGNFAVPLEELVDPEKLRKGANILYAISAVQTFSQDARIPVSNNGATNRIQGVSRTKPRSRLVQSEASTRVLQVLLAFIMLTTVVAYIGVKARELLPRESNSIATIGGYLAGSDVLRLVPDGAEWGAGGKGGGTGSEEVFAGYMFGFGWWEDTERQGRRRYGVGIGRGGG